MKKKIMAIGPVGVGKSTLLNTLGLTEKHPGKTSAVKFSAQALDTPGEAFEIPHLYHMLITSSVKASLIMMLIDPVRKKSLPCRFIHSLRAPTIGVMTKMDIADPEHLSRNMKALRRSGIKKVFHVSSLTGSGIDSLSEFIYPYRK